ncbi:MAG: hypothetical protein ACKVP4_02230 [Hyphomicrobium sp.]
MSQLILGVMVTVIGSVIADSILRGGKRGGFDRGHYAGSFRSNR